MSSARVDGVKFGDLDVNNLSPNFKAVGDMILPGIQSIKGVGDAISAKIIEHNKNGGQSINSVEEFVDVFGKCKTFIEPLIKLGGFRGNRKALWNWYLYNYDNDALYKNMIRYCFAWEQTDIIAEKSRLIDEYKRLYPKRKKVPGKIINWLPTKPSEVVKDLFAVQFDQLTVEDYKRCSKLKLEYRHFLRLFNDDYTAGDILSFEKSIFGFYWHSPLDAFKHNPKNNIENAKTTGVLEVVIESVQKKKTAKSDYLKLGITDGAKKASVMVWGNELAINDPDVFAEGVGIKIQADWKDDYKSFSLYRGAMVETLPFNNECVAVGEAQECDASF
jgi:DNA polymerase III alpha subunit